MQKNLYIDASHPDETRVVLKSENHIEEYEYENRNKLYLKNNIYLGKVSRVEPSLQAAFVNYGKQRHGFLAFNDIQSDYYQIPHDDKERLKKEEEGLRLELKEKSKNVEENEKPSEIAWSPIYCSTAFMPTKSSTSFLLHPSWHGAGQTLPIIEVNGFAVVDLLNAYSCIFMSAGGFSIPLTISNHPRISSPEGQLP